MTTTKPKKPDGLKDRGTGFWERTCRDYELTDSEMQLLAEACRTMDNLDALADALTADGPTIKGSMGQTIVHPALGEARGQRLVLHKLLAVLALPDLEDEAAPTISTPRQVASQQGNTARWQDHNRRMNGA